MRRSTALKSKVLGIYVFNDVIYIHTCISNDTNISFEVDARRFIVADRKLAKRTAQQQTSLEILRVCNDPAVVRGAPASADGIRAAQAYDPRRKVLLLEIVEKKRSPAIRRWRYPQGNCWMRNSCKETGGRTRCGSFFYAAVGMFRIRAAILQEHFCKRIFRRGSARCGSERLFVSEQSDTPYGFQTVPGCLSCGLRNSIFIFVEEIIRIDYQYIIS